MLQLTTGSGPQWCLLALGKVGLNACEALVKAQQAALDGLHAAAQLPLQAVYRRGQLPHSCLHTWLLGLLLGLLRGLPGRLWY